MTDTPTPYGAICEEVRRRDRADGALLVVFLDGGCRIVLTVEVGEGTGHVDELFLRHVVMLTSDVGVAGVVFAVVRSSGRPTRIDKLLWRELSGRLAGATTSLLDLAVVGKLSWWSAASGRSSPLDQAA
jgi:DNA repair protein RadC